MDAGAKARIIVDLVTYVYFKEFAKHASIRNTLTICFKLVLIFPVFKITNKKSIIGEVLPP